jgi:magnesium transporter
MNRIDIAPALDRLRVALEGHDIEKALRILESLRSPDQAEVFSELDEHQQSALLPKLNPSQSADILEELEDREAAGLLASLPTEAAIRIVDEMEPDEAADVLSDVPHPMVKRILQGLEDPEEVRPLLLHPENTAGGLMTSEFLALRRRMTAAEALQAIHDWRPDVETVYSLFVVNRSRQLCGVVNLRQLIVAEPDARLADIMDPDVISVTAEADQEQVARLMTRYNLLALPVVDQEMLLIGVITVDDVIDVIEDEATEDFQRLGGALPLEQPYLRIGVGQVARKRIGWLMLLFVTESLTGTVLRHFQDELETVVALAFFVPLLIGTGGNAGSQTTSTVIRALALGEIGLGDAIQAWWHEMRIGLLLGAGMSIFAFLRALLWGSNDQLALTVSSAIFAIVVWANGLGVLLPLFAARLRVDPTVVSGPVMSTLVDATGLYIYFRVAGLILGL